MLTAKAIRQGFIDFFKSKDHVFIPSSPIVLQEDPTLLFTNAGMNQFKDIFLGSRTPQAPRVVNSQKCIRVSGKHNDLEEVGKDTYHHTFFEMLGNWSFGDYFKAEAITWAWELLTKVWKIDEHRLWVTVFGGDSADGLTPDIEAESLWVKLTRIPKERVLRFGRKDNFWEMGDTGPCGVNSEIHIDLGKAFCDKQHDPKHICQVNGDCGRFIELWNLVFIQFNRDDSGKLSELPAKHVDTGAGLERVVAVLQNKASNYDTDLFSPIMSHLTQISGKHYTAKLGNDNDNAFRVIADHVRTLTFALTDGVTPGNNGRGYVLRRILRRATRYGLKLDLNEPFIHKLVPTVVEIMGEAYPELKDRAQHAANVIEAEEASFGKTLQRGMDIFEQDVAELQKLKSKRLSGNKAFKLYDTYGFPLDLTQLMAAERDLSVDVEGFNTLMEQQKALAQASQKGAVYQADALAELLPATPDADKYHTHRLDATVVGYINGDGYITSGKVPPHARVGLVLDRTCAYAEAGGQVGDRGEITWDSKNFLFEQTQRIGSAVAHWGATDSDDLTVGAKVVITISSDREDTARHHTATHLLQWALQNVLGKHAHQEGSLVCPDYLRFDFTHPKALTGEELRRVETLVNEKIQEACPVTAAVLPQNQARQLGAMALFSEKYGDEVRVLAIGAEHPDILDVAFSKEFCGGTHVTNTRDIGGFKIVREESVATGVRRITAVTGRALNQMLSLHSKQIEQLTQILKTTPQQVVDRVNALLEENKKLKKQLKKGAAADLKSVCDDLLANAPTLGDTKVIIGEVPEAPLDNLRGEIDRLRKKAPSSVILLANTTEEGKVMLLSSVTDDLIKRGLEAGDIVGHIAPIVGGGGGGRPQLAQAGGKNPEKLSDALKAAEDFIREKTGW
ncbi:MAG: alanine--tRNA ligase [Sedimentisphaerales bacterium]|nr:alanine--tRNA ligase [Sedimentisphaerales bacterium]